VSSTIAPLCSDEREIVRGRQHGPVPDELARIIGVYDADGSVRGELAYFLRARIGRAHCALCDVTHGRVRQRPEWIAASSRLAVPFVTFHRDDQPTQVAAAVGDELPVVVAETVTGRIIPLLDRRDLERCSGSTGRLVDSISEACARAGLSLAPPEPSADGP
jgi:hypothetical protein